jgi:hypothetical protein
MLAFARRSLEAAELASLIGCLPGVDGLALG